MAPATSTTDVCCNRPAHGALAVRHVHVTPAAERGRQLAGRTERNRARGRNARRGPSYKYRKPPPCDGRAHAPFIHTRCARTRTQPDQEARARAHTHTRARPRTHTHTNTNTHASADTRVHATARIKAHTVLAERRAGRTCDGIGDCMSMCCDGGRAARANGLKCVRRWVGLVRTPWVSLDYPSSTPPVVPSRVPL